MAKANNQVEESAVSEQQEPQDQRKFIDTHTDKDGNESTVEHQVADFNDEQKNVFNKLEILVTQDNKLTAQYEFQHEQNQILSNHYVAELKKLLSSGEDQEPEVVSDGEAEKEAK